MINGTLYLMAFPVCYLVFRYFHLVWFGVFYNTITIFMAFMLYCYLAQKYLPSFSMFRHFVQFFIKNFVTLCLVLGILQVVKHAMPQGLIRLFTICLLSTGLVLTSGYYLGMDKDMRKQVRNAIKKFFSKFKRHKNVQ